MYWYWLMFSPSTHEKARTVAKTLDKERLIRFGIPSRIHSDQGRNFESNILKKLCAIYGTEKNHTTLWHPQGNGQCERSNQTMFDRLRTIPPEKNRHVQDFSLRLWMHAVAYRTPRQGTLLSTFSLVGNPGYLLATRYRGRARRRCHWGMICRSLLPTQRCFRTSCREAPTRGFKKTRWQCMHYWVRMRRQPSALLHIA